MKWVATSSAWRSRFVIGQGVRFVACQNTMRQRTLGQADLLPGVGTVPSGAYEIVRRQQEGYSYFKP